MNEWNDWMNEWMNEWMKSSYNAPNKLFPSSISITQYKLSGIKISEILLLHSGIYHYVTVKSHIIVVISNK